MASSGNFGSVESPESALGMLVQAEAAVHLGTQTTFSSLEVSSDTYSAYGASIGLQDGKKVSLGEVSELGVTINSTVEPFESVNVRQPTIYVVSEEETTINVGLTEFNYQVIEILLKNGVMVKLDSAPNNEYLYTWGGSCAIKSRPMNIGVTNIACYLPEGADAQIGVTGISMTFYDTLCQTGLVWDNITAVELNTIATEWTARPVRSLANGNQVGSLYLW